jgi:hypothetical protein
LAQVSSAVIAILKKFLSSVSPHSNYAKATDKLGSISACMSAREVG